MNITQEEVSIASLGPCRIPSPYKNGSIQSFQFVSNLQKILFGVEQSSEKKEELFITLEQAGPREEIFFDPSSTTAAVVTCGGLSPGLNNVIRSITSELVDNYQVKRVLGIRHGYQGFVSSEPPLILDKEITDIIHLQGGSILGSSRGMVSLQKIVERLSELQVDLLFCIGGDGTQAGALAISQLLRSQKKNIAVIGIPKTIDNDVPFVWQSFGFSTAVERARAVIESARLEADSFLNTVSIVKLMGRDAGFIAVHATLVSQDVDFTLIPEVPFAFEGEGGILSAIHQKLLSSGSVVVVVSEGVGSKQFDIGSHLSDKIKKYLSEKGINPIVRYFDPGYSIRAVPANTSDAFLCDQLARAAVHAGMAGKTELLIGHWYNNFVHIPLETVCKQKKRVNPMGRTWQHLLSVTGQSKYLR